MEKNQFVDQMNIYRDNGNKKSTFVYYEEKNQNNNNKKSKIF